MFHYRAYDLNIESQLAFKGLLPARPGVGLGTIRIGLGKVPRDLPDASLRERYHQAEPGRFLLGVEGVGRYLVSEGSQIIVEPAPGAASGPLRTFLLGPAMGALLFQRGLLPIQASAIETSRGAVVFIGPPDSGKSLLAAAFHQRGYRLMIDGLCTLALGHGALPIVFPAFPHLHPGPGGVLEEDLPDPRHLALGVGYSPRSRPLLALCALGWHDAPIIVQKAVRGLRRRDLLVQSLHTPFNSWGLPERERLLHTAGALADRIQLREIARPRDASRVEEVVDRFEREWCARVEPAF